MKTRQKANLFKTNMAQEVFKFKQKYYLSALAVRNFNISKTAREIGGSRGDIQHHVGDKQSARKLAKVLDLI